MKLTACIAAFLCAASFATAEDASVPMGVEQTNRDSVALNDGNFQENIASGKVVVEFYASWCGACKHFTPIFDATAAEHKGAVRFAKANADEAKAAMRQYGIKSYPTVILFEDGKEVRRFSGSKDKSVFEEFLGLRAPAARAPAPAQAAPHRKVERRVSKPNPSKSQRSHQTRRTKR